MVFSSLFFMFVFFPIVFLAYFLMPRRGRNLVLLIASLVFYAWGEPKYIVLMLLSIVVNYVLVLLMEKNPNQKKILFMVALLFNLGLLGFFKYYDFFIENVNYLFHLSLEGQHIPLPIGISFYTFQILSYVIDAYTGKTKAQQNIISFALYVTMFPQLVAGPIVKYTDIQIQLSERQESFEKIGLGAERFIAGLAKKVLLANTIGYLFTTIQEMEFGSLSVLTAWLGMIAFTLQIYFDFSGYSDMAIGLGKMFGFDFLENFNDPYISKSVTEFWRRWHMSLGGWFREYVYIPLGGNRLGIKKQIRNLLIVWLLTGLWHGASWNFVTWGVYYGVLLFIEKIILKQWLEKWPSWLRHAYTLILVIIGWTFFSIENLGDAFSYLKVMFGFSGHALYDKTSMYYLMSYGLLLILGVICSTPLLKQIQMTLKSTKWGGLLLVVQVTLLLLSTAYLVTTTYNPFLYFRF